MTEPLNPNDFLKEHKRIRLPRPLRQLARMVVSGIFVGLVILIFVPWVQTAKGRGRITSINPEDQLQAIHAPVQGRIDRWYVQDGSVVKAGDPIVDVVDNDPEIINRLKAELDAMSKGSLAATIAAETAHRNLERQEALHKQGLSSRREYEQSIIEYKSWRAKEAEANSKLAMTQVKLSRQYTQHIFAPRDGRIVRTYAGAGGTLVKEGDTIADFLPADAKLAVELFVQGIDMPLVQVGQKVRLQFEGWPIVQFSGWPSTAVGTFAGEVKVVDSAVSPNGRLRVLVTAPENEPWPDTRYLAFGARAQGWVLLSTVPIGYELWRQLNGFPPEPPPAALPTDVKKN